MASAPVARGGAYAPTAEYARWNRARWIDRFGRKTQFDRWQKHEDAMALDMHSRGKTAGQIALRVRRTPDAVAARLRYLRERGR